MVRSRLLSMLVLVAVTTSAAASGGSCEDVVLEAADPVEDVALGQAIAFDGERLVVTRDESNGVPVSAFVYRLDAGAWILEDELAAPGMHYTFGRSAAISGDHILIGAHLDGGLGSHIGAVYAFRRSGSEWLFEERLTALEPDVGSYFGSAVALDGDTAVIGALFHDGGGRAYAFRYAAETGWVEEAALTASPPEPFDRFGVSVALDGGVIAVGASVDDGGPGSIHVFRHDGAEWTFEDELFGAGAGDGDGVGSALALEGDRLVATAPDQGDGTVHVFHHDGAVWTETATFGTWGGAGESFGYGLGADGDVIVVGARGASGPHVDSGAVYLYRFDGAIWHPDVKLIGSAARESDWYGDEVLVHEGRVIVSTPWFDGSTFDDSGAVWIHDAPTFVGPDCNGDRIDDACEILAGADDCNGNGIPTSCEPTCAGDIDCDGMIGFGELLQVLANWGPCLPTESRPENEPCGADTNGGCGTDFDDPVLEPLACDETVDGTSWFDGTVGDFDWFAIELVQPTVLTVSATLGGGGFVAMPVTSCNLPAYSEFASGPPGATIGFTTARLDPGTYWILIGIDPVGPVFTCGVEESAWTLSVACTPDAPCVGDYFEDGTVDLIDLLSVLSDWGPCS